MPTGCNAILQGYELGCPDAQGGVQKFYITEHDNIASYTEASGVLLTLVLNDGKRFWEYQQELETANYVEAPNPNRQNGTISYDQTVTIQLNKRSASTSYALRALATQKVAIIGVEQTGTMFLLGARNGLRLAPSTSPTGTTMNDHNGYVLTFGGKEPLAAFTVSDDILDTVVV